MPPTASLSPPWVRIHAATPEVHLQIARDFVTTIQDEHAREELSKTLDDSRAAWWPIFWLTVRRFGIDRKWIVYKKDRLLSKLDEELLRHGITNTESILHPAKPIASESITTTAQQPESPAGKTALSRATDTNLLRRVVLKIVNNLPAEELRSLRLPVGEVLDAIANGD
jgi:hypothetical protein